VLGVADGGGVTLGDLDEAALLAGVPRPVLRIDA